MERKLDPKEEFALDLIMQALDLTGWTIALPQDPSEPLHYMIIGTEDGVDLAMKRINGEVQ